MIIDIPSHQLSAFDVRQPHQLEVLPSGSITFRSTQGGHAIETATHATDPNGAVQDGEIAPNGSLYTFTPETAGAHTITLELANGRTVTLKVYAFSTAWLAKVRLPAGSYSEATFDAKARLVLRSIAKAGGLAVDGSVPADLNLAAHGAASGAGVHRSEL